MKCKLADSNNIHVTEHLEIVMNDKVVDPSDGIKIINESDACANCELKEKCLDNMKKLGIVYREIPKSKVFNEFQTKKNLAEFNNSKNEFYSINYVEGDLIVKDIKKCLCN